MGKLHVDVVGAGSPLVLLHGWAMHGGVFAALTERLRAHHCLYLVDLPGHGLSRDSNVPLTLDAGVTAILERVPPAPWCGWSLGGLFALHAAASQPQQVPQLVMLCASPRFVRDVASDGGYAWPYGVSAQIFHEFADGLRQNYRATLERFIALEAFGSDHTRQEIRMLRDAMFARGEPSTEILADGLRLLETADLRAQLPTLQVPSLWLAGRRDRLVDPRAMRQAASATPGAQMQVIEHAGHAPFLTHDDDLATRLTAFLAHTR